MEPSEHASSPYEQTGHRFSNASSDTNIHRTADLLRERTQLDELLRQQYRRDITLLFTDIEDSTAYFEQRGDLSGRQMVQRHNDILFPIIERHDGTIVKTMGDGIMASYGEPTAAVQSAIAMQRSLRDYNRGQELSEQLHIRVGINSGRGFVETDDVFGDVVNVAARVESRALPDQILISSATYERLPDSIPCRLLGTTEAKGKATPIELYEVHWDERRTLQETVLLRGPGVTPQPGKIFVLDLSCDHERLKVSAHERWPGEEPPVKGYAYLDVPLASIDEHVNAMVELLSQATDRRGALAAEVWQELQVHGEALYQLVLPYDIREKLQTTIATDLFLYIDDALVHIPWELLFDGQLFLCRRFSMGRIVSTQQALIERQKRTSESGLKILIIANPQGDLDAAGREGSTIQTELTAENQRLQVDLRHTAVETTSIRLALSQYDVVHYAGHADYNLQEPAQSGWQLSNGTLTARDIGQLGKTGPLPALVFCNACQSGQTEAWTITQAAEQDIYGLANVFLLAGAQHYIGSFWEIPDQPSSTFAIDFYRALARGLGVGEALRSARHALIEQYGEDSVVWASYVLYGDPTVQYLEASQQRLDGDHAAAPAEALRGESAHAPRRTFSPLVVAGALVSLVFLIAVVALLPRWWARTPDLSPLTLAYEALHARDWSRAETLFGQLRDQSDVEAKSQAYAGLAALALARGDYQQALDFADQAEKRDPEIAFSHVIRGNVLWNQGKMAEAAAAYRLATQKPHALPWQHAQAYNRLGRISAAQGEPDRALEQYDKAIQQHQNMAEAYANKAYLLEQQGQHQDAIALYRQARQIDPSDPLTARLLEDAERRQQHVLDTARQQRINQLVADLEQADEAGKPRRLAGDGWRSRPLTLALFDLQPQGTLAPRAGEAAFLRMRLTQALQTHGRVQLVERAVLETLLKELTLSLSPLVDSDAPLYVGRVLAARFIATGSITRMGNTVQVHVRVIETETTRSRASETEVIELSDGRDAIIEQMAQGLVQSLQQVYPLQGRIVRVTPEGIVLDIGAEHGVSAGLVMRVFGAEEPLTPVGQIEVTHVQSKRAQARVLEQSTALQQGWKVQERSAE